MPQVGRGRGKIMSSGQQAFVVEKVLDMLRCDSSPPRGDVSWFLTGRTCWDSWRRTPWKRGASLTLQAPVVSHALILILIST